MKVKLKKTKEIINIAEYDKIQLDVCDSYGTPIEVDYNDIEQFYDDNGFPLNTPIKFNSILDTENNNYWNNIKINASIAIMQGLIANSTYDNTAKQYAKLSVDFADALIEELKNRN